MSILGIDLGTTNSLACVWKGKEAILIPNAFGSYLTPSVVSFLENGEVLVGEGAKQRLHTHPSLTFAEFKRCMGTDTVYTVHGKTYYPQDLSAMVIRKLVEDASVFLNERIEEAIISVPAYFSLPVSVWSVSSMNQCGSLIPAHPANGRGYACARCGFRWRNTGHFHCRGF